MIDLTPLDVRKKKDDFKRAVRGYDAQQVDAFLDVVADRLETLVREHGSLGDKVGHLDGSLKTYQERERALNEALLAAQELREEARSQAERDASVRLREAETHAEAILLDADQAIRHSQRRLEDLRARRRQFLKALRTMMDRFEDYLELEETRLESEPEDLGDLLERLQTDIGGKAAERAAAPTVKPGVAPAGEAALGEAAISEAALSDAALNGDTAAAEDSQPDPEARIAPKQTASPEAGGSGTPPN